MRPRSCPFPIPGQWAWPEKASSPRPRAVWSSRGFYRSLGLSSRQAVQAGFQFRVADGTGRSAQGMSCGGIQFGQAGSGPGLSIRDARPHPQPHIFDLHSMMVLHLLDDLPAHVSQGMRMYGAVRQQAQRVSLNPNHPAVLLEAWWHERTDGARVLLQQARLPD